jgi:hypothetical protein
MLSRRRRILVTSAATLAGVALFVYAVDKAGLSNILDAIHRVGRGLFVILVLAGLRFAVRAECWRRCLGGQSPFPFRRALVAFLAGDAVGSVTPLGLVASEPTKVLLTRHHLAGVDAVASLALENLIYAASVGSFTVFGVLLVALASPTPRLWLLVATAAALALAAGGGVALWALRTPGPRGGDGWRGRLERVRADVRRLLDTDPARLWTVYALDWMFHGLAVFEVYVTLGWLDPSRRPVPASAVAFETLNRVITVVFKFVPFRVGIDEALSAMVAPVVAVNPALGVALAVVRKVRNLFWAAVGLTFVAAHPVTAPQSS